MGAEEGYQRSPEPCPTRPEVSSSPTSLCPSPYLEHTSPRAACPLPTVSGSRPGRRHLSSICITAGAVSGGVGVSGIHLLVGRVHTLRQVLNSLVPQLFSGQAPAGHRSIILAHHLHFMRAWMFLFTLHSPRSERGSHTQNRPQINRYEVNE